MKKKSQSINKAEPGELVAAFDNLVKRTTTVLLDKLSEPLANGLYIIATPIGNLSDISLRALSVLARTDRVYCEDTRHTRKLLSHYAIEADLRSYHDHSSHHERTKIIEFLSSGKSMALVSDAGTPLISDPGFKLVREAQMQELNVFIIPGPSAITSALPISGLPTDRFFFEGFLPVKSGQRQNRLAELKSIDATLVFYEAAQRLQAALSDMSEKLGVREAVIAKELTKHFETVSRGTFKDLLTGIHETKQKGEFVIIVAPPEKVEVNDIEIVEALSVQIETMSFRDAVQTVADDMSVSRKHVYELGLKMRKQ